MFIYYFSKINRIKMLSDTLSDLAKVNHWEFSKYHLCPSKINMVHAYILFFKDKSTLNGSKVIMVPWTPFLYARARYLAFFALCVRGCFLAL